MTTNTPFDKRTFPLNWTKNDPEQKMGFNGGKFTTPNKSLSLLTGILLTAVFFAAVTLCAPYIPGGKMLSAILNDRGPTQYATMFFFFWGLSILWLKSRKLAFQRSVMQHQLISKQHDFKLTPETARETLNGIHELADVPSQFLMLARMEQALSNLDNIGQAADISAILDSQSDADESQIASGYTLVQGFLWAIPVLGFIGTVLGLSSAIGAFGTTLAGNADLSGIKSSLSAVTGGLSTAFDTTLLALLCALVLQLLITFLQTKETEFLDSCKEFSNRNILGNLRLRVDH